MDVYIVDLRGAEGLGQYSRDGPPGWNLPWRGMHASVTVTPAQLPELLLHVAVVRPVFIWGQPGIGKSSLVEEFAAQVGLECCTLLGT